MSSKRVRWLQKRARNLNKKGRTTQGNRRLKLLRELDAACKTIKLKKDVDGLYDGRWVTAGEAVDEINRLFNTGTPYRVYDRKLDIDPFGRHRYTTERKVLGHYLRAEITDIGELWVRFTESDVLWGLPEKKVEYGPRERNDRLSARQPRG